MSSSLQTASRSGSASPLPRSTCEEQGLSSNGVVGFLDEVDQHDLELHSLMVLRHDQVVAEGWWHPYAADQVHLLFSLSKSFTSTAIGMAVAEGLLSIDDPVTSFWPEAVPDGVDDRVKEMTVRHLLTMGTGHRADTLDQVRAADPSEPYAAFFALPPEEKPGSLFTYHNTATYLLSLIVQKLTGQTLLTYLHDRLFEPIGIGERYWATDVLGRELGFSGLHLHTEDVARFGLLYLHGGAWAGRQLVPSRWVTQATSFQIDNSHRPDASGPDSTAGYGFQFWMCQPGGYRGDGAFGQFCVILPEHDLIVVTTSGSDKAKEILAAIWNNLLPALSDDPLPADAQAQTDLTHRLSELSLPPVPRARDLDHSELPHQWHAPEDGVVSALMITEAVNGWTATVTGNGQQAEVAAGLGEWQHSVLRVDGAEASVWASAGWQDAGFVMEIIFVHTPHRLHLVGPIDGGPLQLSWNVVPQRARRLSDLAAPGWRSPQP